MRARRPRSQGRGRRRRRRTRGPGCGRRSRPGSVFRWRRPAGGQRERCARLPPGAARSSTRSRRPRRCHRCGVPPPQRPGPRSATPRRRRWSARGGTKCRRASADCNAGCRPGAGRRPSWQQLVRRCAAARLMRVRRPAHPEIPPDLASSLLQLEPPHRQRIDCSRAFRRGTAVLWVRGPSGPLPPKAAPQLEPPAAPASYRGPISPLEDRIAPVSGS